MNIDSPGSSLPPAPLTAPRPHLAAFFLQGWRATLIPMLAVPVALVGTFVFFPLFGFSINTLSLLGLVLAIGLVVDDAIVVVEAVERHIEGGVAPKDAVLKAMREISGPVVGIALVLSAVFIPTAFVPGITGRLYQQFALTIAISVILSAFNAFSLSPALAALLLRPKKESRGPLRSSSIGSTAFLRRRTFHFVFTSSPWMIPRPAVIPLNFARTNYAALIAIGGGAFEEQGHSFEPAMRMWFAHSTITDVEMVVGHLRGRPEPMNPGASGGTVTTRAI